MSTSAVSVHKVGESLGAVVEGIRLGPDIDDATAVRLNELLNEHQVLFFRGQDHLTDALEYGFAARLGVPTAPHPTVSSDTDLLPIEGAANSWHTDVSFIDRVPKASILRAVTLPAYSGATQWASATAAYDLLPEPLRLLAHNLRTVRVLQRHAVNPDLTVRWSWAPGDVAIWDNRATQHYGVNDFGGQVRLLQRVTLAGDLPVGVDGRPSVVLKGDASHYSPIVQSRVSAVA